MKNVLCTVNEKNERYVQLYDSDLLLKIVDISSIEFDMHLESIDNVLNHLKISNKNYISDIGGPIKKKFPSTQYMGIVKLKKFDFKSALFTVLTE